MARDDTDTEAAASTRKRGRGLARGSRDFVLAIAMVVGVLLLSGVLNLNQVALQSQLRFSLSDIDTECQLLDQANATLSMQLAPLAALTAIEVRATEAGLGPAKQIEYLNVPEYMPSNTQP